MITLINNVWESEAIVGEASVQIGKGIKNLKKDICKEGAVAEWSKALLVSENK